MKIGPLPDALPDAVESGFHCVRTHWIRGFMAFQLARRARSVMLMVLAWPDSGGRAITPNRGAVAELTPVADNPGGAG